MSGGPTIRDVAREAQTSLETVSRVLNGRYKATTARGRLRVGQVLAVAKRLGYRPDLGARSMRATDMGIIGVLGLQMPVNLPQATVEGLLDVLAPRGFTLSAHYNPRGAPAHRLPPWRIDGAVVVDMHDRAELEPVEASGLPYVSINGWAGPRGSAVRFDDADGMRQLVRHLVGVGHRRIAYANAYRDRWHGHPSVAVRHRAFTAALRSMGAAPAIGHEMPLSEDREAFLRAIRADGATALIVYHHFHGVELHQACLRLGLRVPQDLSIACFNDEWPVQFLDPGLTAVAMPSREAGAAAGRLLLARIDDADAAPETATLPATLVPRGSTAPPA